MQVGDEPLPPSSIIPHSSGIIMSDTQLCGIISPRLRCFIRPVYECAGCGVGIWLLLKT